MRQQLQPCSAHVHGQDGRMRPAVEAYLCSLPGLVVTTLDPRKPWWRITHRGSGQAIGGGGWGEDACRFATPEQADEAALRWLAGVRWLRTAQEIAEDKAAAAAVLEMVQGLRVQAP